MKISSFRRRIKRIRTYADLLQSAKNNLKAGKYDEAKTDYDRALLYQAISEHGKSTSTRGMALSLGALCVGLIASGLLLRVDKASAVLELDVDCVTLTTAGSVSSLKMSLVGTSCFVSEATTIVDDASSSDLIHPGGFTAVGKQVVLQPEYLSRNVEMTFILEGGRISMRMKGDSVACLLTAESLIWDGMPQAGVDDTPGSVRVISIRSNECLTSPLVFDFDSAAQLKYLNRSISTIRFEKDRGLGILQSSILGGTVKIQDVDMTRELVPMDSLSTMLAEEATIRITKRDGELHLTLLGEVEDLKSGFGSNFGSLMPAWLIWIYYNEPAKLLYSALLFLWPLLFKLYDFFKRAKNG